MRKEPFFVGDIVHVFNRGNRKQEIVRDDKDRKRFIQMLYYFNDEYAPLNLWKSDFHNMFERLPEWPERDPLVEIHGFTLMFSPRPGLGEIGDTTGGASASTAGIAGLVIVEWFE